MPSPISELIAGLSTSQRSATKATEIAKLNLAGSYEKYGVTIECISGRSFVIKNRTGLEVLVRGWKDGSPLGFGSDGSVEIERIRIFNPPILVKNAIGDGFIEDLKTATYQSLAHTVSVIGKLGTNLKRGKIGNTTSTFYPDPGPTGTTSIAGSTFYAVAGASAVSWASIIAQAGNVARDDNDNDNILLIRDGTVLNTWRGLARAIYIIDTSAIPDTDAVSAAVFTVFTGPSLKMDQDSIAPSADVYTSNPASNTDLTGTDFSTLGSVSQTGAPKTYANISGVDGGANDFILNATGISNISKTGVTKFGIREVTYDVGATAPAWGILDNQFSWDGYWPNHTGTSLDPKLVVTHAAAISTAKFFPFLDRR